MDSFDKLKKNLEKASETLVNTVGGTVENIPKVVQDLPKAMQEIPKAVQEIPKAVQGTVEKGGEAFNAWKEKGADAARQRQEALHRPDAPLLLSTKDALKIIYYLMSSDGIIQDKEEEKFDEIARAMDPSFDEHKADLLNECKAQVEKAYDEDDYYDYIHDSIRDIVEASRKTNKGEVQGRLLIWNMLAIVYSDGNRSAIEQRLIRYTAREISIDKAILPEMEASIKTMAALQDEAQWLMDSGREYTRVKEQMEQITKRQHTIMQGVEALITD